MADKIDDLIARFKAIKEELNKNVNASYSGAPNMASAPPAPTPSATPTPAATSTIGARINYPQGTSKSDGSAMFDSQPLGQTEKGETKHDRCAREVGAKGNVDDPHAVCVAAGVEPGKWKKSKDEPKEVLKVDNKGQWSLHMSKVDPQENINIPHPQGKAKQSSGINKMDSDSGTNRQASPLDVDMMPPQGKVRMVKEEGTNEKAGTSRPHNKGKFEVEEIVTEKESPKADVKGKPYTPEETKKFEAEQRDQNKGRMSTFGL
jgi:hypothetical protein